MGLVLAPSEVRGYIGYMKGYLSASMQCYTDTKQKVEDYVADNELLSVAWEQSKETMHVCYQAIVSEMLSVQDNFLSDLDTLDGAVGDEYLNEDQLLARIERLEEECRQYENSIAQMSSLAQGVSHDGLISMISRVTKITENMLANTEAEIAELKKKINFLHEVEDLTVNLFQSALDALNAVSNAIHDGGVAISGGTDFLGSDLLTLSDINMDSECVEDIDDFENYLIEQGFPEGYRKYLMILHEKYPEWRFEAVITGVDYQEFVNYQIANELKCAELDPYASYCTEMDFKGEESLNYYVANKESITFFSHPYSLLQTNQGDYENTLQFLKADQKLPQEYVDLVVSKILSEESQEIIDLVKNADACVNPVFMACIFEGEDGPNGVLYEGKEVYNFFNVGGYTGRNDSIEYAYEHEWFTPEACINGSMEVFQKYLDNGQDTLYALDWDFQTYADSGNVKQYATLVNDAENKAICMSKDKGVMFELNQNFTFKIPVYENIPTYGDGDYGAFPDPNKK